MHPYVPETHQPAIALRFWVTIDGKAISWFTACDGLTAEWEVEEYREGGNRAQVHRLPVRLLYKNVRLTRPIDQESGKLAEWFSSTQTTFTRCNAVVTAFDGNSKKVASWELVGVWPVKYTGPSFTATGTATAATEILELAHNGFTVSN